MKRIGLVVATFMSNVAAVGVAIAGPFGVDAGDPVSKYPDCREVQSGVYRCATLPRPHPSFVAYAILAQPVTGVCAVYAYSQEMSDSLAATEAKKIAEQLIEKYGSKLSAEKTGPYLTFSWGVDVGYTPVDRVAGILLHSGSSSMVGGTSHRGVQLRFFFDTNEACQAERNKRQAEGT